MKSADSSVAPAINFTARAKINLTLHITGKRDDGFHFLESVIGFTDIADILTFSPSDNISCDISGPEAQGLVGDDTNLAIRAARLARRHSGEKAGAHIVLDKHIPMAAGLGGGSADAAAAIDGCLHLWGKNDAPSLINTVLAADLGADVPVCRFGRAALITGIGEQIVGLPPWPETWTVLVNPRVPLSTAGVFKSFSGPLHPPHHLPKTVSPWGASFADFIAVLEEGTNSLTDAAIASTPVISDVLTALERQSCCGLARMSGSGPTCFGLFPTPESAEAATKEITRENPAWWVKASRLVATEPRD